MTARDDELWHDGRMPERPPLDGLRVALDARYVSRPGVGLGRYLFGIIPALTQAGAHLTLLTNFDTAPYEHLFEDVEWCGFGYKTQTFWEQVSVPRYLRKHDFDVHWLPSTMGTPLFSVGKALKVVTVHDLVQLRFPYEYFVRDPLFALPFSVWVVGALFRSDVILTVSKSSAHDIKRFSRRSATIIAPTLGENALTEPTPEENKDLPDGRYLIYNGGLEKRKCVPEMLAGVAEAFRELPDVRLVLMGSSTGQLEPTLRELGIWERCILTGYISEGRKTAILREAAGLLYLSKFEGYGLPLVEALAAGVPILTNRNSSIPEVVDDAALFVESLSPADIANGIRSLLSEPEQTRLRDAGVRRYQRVAPELSADALVTGVRAALLARGFRGLPA